MEERLREQARADEAALALHRRAWCGQLEEAACKRAGKREIVGSADVADQPVGQELAVGGLDGTVRLYDPATGALKREFVAAPMTKSAAGRTPGQPVTGKAAKAAR